MNNDDKIIDTLLAAADFLEVDGWQQGKFGPDDPNVSECRCAAGAIYAARVLVRGPVGGVIAVRDFLDCDTVQWNDVPGRTVEEVVTALRATASDLHERVTA